MLIKKVRLALTGDQAGGNLIKNILILASGTAGAQILGFLFVPILTRIYTPTEFGLLAIFVALLTVATPLVNLRYVVAIPLPRRKETATNLLVFCIALTLMFSLILGYLFPYVGSYLYDDIPSDKLEVFRWLFVLSLMGIGIYEAFSFLAIREKQFKVLAKTKFTQSLLGGLVKILLGFGLLKFYGLLIGHVVSQVSGLVSIILRSGEGVRENLGKVKWKNICFLTKYYISFPVYQIPSELMRTFSLKLPLFFFAKQYGAGEAGQLGLALTIVALPIAIIGQTTRQAFYGEIAAYRTSDLTAIRGTFFVLLRRLAFVSILPFFTLFFLSADMFGIFFGSNWYSAGVYSEILAIYLIVQFLYVPLGGPLLNFFKKNWLLPILDISRLIIMVSIFTFCAWSSCEPKATLLIYSVGLAFHYLVSLASIYKITLACNNER